MINIAGILTDSLANGPGLRYVLFVQGCSHHCPGCQNEHTWEFNKGREMSVEEILKDIENNPFINGVTISGGEPFDQSKDVFELVKALKEKNFNVMIYTGYKYEELVNRAICRSEDMQWPVRIIRQIDILVDGEFEQNNLDLSERFCGSKNQRILYLKNGKIIKEE